MLKINHITKILGDKEVLHDCSWQVKQGSVTGLIGPNGAGKSTLLRCISDVYQCNQGDITWNDQLIQGNVELKQNILLLSDDPFYMHNASIADMKQFYKTFYPQFNDEIYYQYLKMFKLDENKVMNNFSKGMKRQSFILMALAIRPQLLLLDESFDGLDPMMRLLFKRAITECIDSHDMTIIISSHNLRELEDICDSFAILENNSITSSGLIDDSKNNIHKIQLAYASEKTKDDFNDLNIIHYSQNSRVINLVVEGDLEQIQQQLEATQPLLMEILNVSLEEIFLYEMEKKGVFEYE